VPDPTFQRPTLKRSVPRQSIDPTLTRKGALAHPGTLLLGALALVFTAYVLGYLPQLDVFSDHAVRVTRDQGLPIAAPILLGIVGLIVLFVLLLILRSLFDAIRSARKSVSFLGRETISIPSFVLSAAENRIGSRVAIETYNLLKPHYPKTMCIEVEDDLRRELRLSDENILFLQSQLLNRCDRRELLSFSVGQITTILDLMRHAEHAPPQHLSEPSLRRQAGFPSSSHATPASASVFSKTSSAHPNQIYPVQKTTQVLPPPDFIPPRRFSDTGERRRATDPGMRRATPFDRRAN
jgi:hypothetical protein